MILPFVKMQTIGNDFVLVRESDIGGMSPNGIAQLTGNRRFSVGHDGLLVVAPESRGLRVRFFNPDGTEDFCGNGLRCAGLFAFQEGWVGSTFEQRQNGLVIRTVVNQGTVTTQMPAAEFDPVLVPVCSTSEWIEREVEGVKGTALSTGSTHFVVFTHELPESPEFERVSAMIENSPVFPQKTTVMWSKMEDSHLVDVRIWERGVGETLGCGTGAIAVAVVLARKTDSNGLFTIRSGGGDLEIDIEKWNLPVKVASQPKRVFRGVIELQ